ncbi:MAG: type II secretion system protein [Phycisphaerae bacterium]|nr:type II secretion system protein [Phycisphaerae bacterium]
MRNKAFTLIELMVVILIVGILAAASVPLMRGRVDSAKWAEANATAGTIRSAARVYFAEHGTVSKDWADLGFDTAAGDLAGTYFGPSDYEITSVDSATGNVAVTVKGSKANAPKGSKTLSQDGSTWQ